MQVYVGCYTDVNQEGIHIFDVNATSGAYSHVGCVSGIENAIHLTVSKKHPMLYAGQGLSVLGKRAKNGCVAAYEIRDKMLIPAGHIGLGVTPPCYVALSPDEDMLVFSEYTNSTSGVVVLGKDGGLPPAADAVVQHTGSGPSLPRQDKAHAHCAEVTPDGKYLCVVDLGIDRVKLYDLEAFRAERASGKSGELELNEVRDGGIKTAPGAGPRHIVFHPNKRLAILINELDNTLSSYAYGDGKFRELSTVGLLPGDFEGISTAAAVRVSADGRRVFGSNRGDESIVAFDLDGESGKLTLKARSPLAGSGPRDFALLPGERFALVAHQNTNTLMMYSYDADSGKLKPFSKGYTLHQPVVVTWR